LPEAAAHEFIYCAPQSIGERSAPKDPAYVPGARSPELQFRHGELAIQPGSGTLWEQRVLPRLAHRARANVLFCPGYSGPIFGDVPLVVAIHDVSFAAHPEWFRWREGLRRRLVTRWSAQRAARVITVSEFSRREIAEHLGVPASKIDVIYHGVPRLCRQADARTVTRETGGMLLYVGSIFNRRHLPETIRGFSRLARRRPEARLTIVGDNRTTPYVDLQQVIDNAGQSDRVETRAYVPDPELADLYKRARAFVFLSEYEGFGLTPLEALASGIPIVVLDTPVAREVYGPAALYVPQPDPRIIEQVLEAALFDESTRARVLSQVPSVLGRYSWQACAKGVLNALERAAANAPHRQ
jgi:glycosyltransferase involved in cell wall biosynthesis